MSNLSVVSKSEVNNYGPTNNPFSGMPDNWVGTVFDLLELENIEFSVLAARAIELKLIPPRCTERFREWNKSMVAHLVKTPRSQCPSSLHDREAFAEYNASIALSNSSFFIGAAAAAIEFAYGKESAAVFKLAQKNTLLLLLKG